jgi:Na+/H+ antiporter NhaC
MHCVDTAGRPLSLLCVLILMALSAGVCSAQSIALDVPSVVLRAIPFDVSASGLSPGVSATLTLGGQAWVARADSAGEVEFADVSAEDTGAVSLTLAVAGSALATAQTRAIPGWVSVLPPLVAIFIALVFHSVIPALFIGAWLGAFAIVGIHPAGLWMGLLSVFQVHVKEAVADPDHAAIMLFTFMIGGMVGIVSRNGGMQGVVARISGWASTARRGQVATAGLGVAIFFDDYANTLVVGNTMRPVTDRLRISREKLAFLVDATAAPIACIALVTTWVGYEVGLIDAAIADLAGFEQAAYLVYLNSVAYSFYPLLMLLFVFLVAAGGRDFGPMFVAEHRARTSGRLVAEGRDPQETQNDPDLQPPEDKPQRSINAILPVAMLILGVLGGLLVTGEGDSIVDIIGSADSYKALMWASLLAVLTAAALTLAQRILSLEQTVRAWYGGVRQMLFAMIILVLAWTLGSITETLHAADYLASLLGDFLAPGVVPTVVFVLAALTAFATGTSWGAMGILLPLVVPLVWAILELNGINDAAHLHILYSSIACVLSGAVWGDHCSPISDTTILSSMASGCDHVDHVTTQLPYALMVGAVALLLGTLPAGFGLPWWLVLLVSAIVVVLANRLLGRTILPAAAAGASIGPGGTADAVGLVSKQGPPGRG